jgi:hypothetical protein
MLIVMRAIVRLAAVGCDLQLVGEGGGPLLPREVALLGQLDGEGERLGLPGLGKHGATRVARQARQ